MKKAIPIIILVIILMYGCKDSIVENEEPARINFQEGTIEGIKNGDDTTTVIKKLGRPDWIGLGDVDGFYFGYLNKKKPNREITIEVFILSGIYFGFYPKDYRIADITVMNSYDGKSKEGIGIGTSRSEVINKLGNPVAIYEYGEYYYFTRTDKKINTAAFSYDERQKVKSISVDTRAI